MSFGELGTWSAPLLDHLWQSTVFAGGIGVLALALRRNAARVRYRLWMAASLKFLIPFSLLMALGARLPWPAHLERTQPAIATAVAGVAQPMLEVWPAGTNASLSGIGTRGEAEHPVMNWLPFVLLSVWGAGSLLLLGRWMTNWLRLRAAVRRGEPVMLANGIRARVMEDGGDAGSLEPGVFGIVRPVLVLPRGIAERLSGEQMHAIVAHELCHMRRRDNLTAALHMAVEAVFWFHPLVWWLRTRLVEERERACDEAVLEATRQPFAYAEGILNVCKFYVETPLSCVSGVTGSELKQRIARILSGQRVRKLDLRRKALLAVACVVAVGLPVTAGLAHAAQGQRQAAAPSEPTETGIAGTGIVGTWQGTAQIPDGGNARVVLKIVKDEKGELSGTLYSIDQSGRPMPGSAVSFAGGTLRFVNQFPGFTYEGKMSADGKSISGTMTQNGSYPLVLERATAGTEWTIPAPPQRLPPMAADAHPTFDVATVKPTAADARRSMLTVRGADLVIENLSLNALIKFAWEVQEREIEAGPGWMSTDKWDIQAKPDVPGMPNPDQLREMVRKLLADRFGLKFREEQREMAAYVLTVGKDGPKLMKSADASQLGGFTMGPLGVMHAGGATMGDFVHIMQGDILDRPVVDKTGLQGRWDFTLRWTPDETQFAGARVPRPTAEDADAPPPLFTAIQEQLGLKLEPAKTEVPVLVVEHVEKPTAN